MTDQRNLAAEVEDIRKRHSSTVIHGWGGEDVDTLLAYIDLQRAEISRLNEKAQQMQVNHRKEIREIEREARDDCRKSVAEARWQERQREDYGSY